MSDLMIQGLQEMFNHLGDHPDAPSKRKRYNQSRDWTSADFLKWYAKEWETHVSRNMAADYLYGMEDNQVTALTRVANDLLDDLARHRKRKIAIEQLNENEQLKSY